MNWAQFKDPTLFGVFAGTVVASWSFTQEVAGLSPFTVMTNFYQIQWKHLGKTQIFYPNSAQRVLKKNKK